MMFAGTVVPNTKFRDVYVLQFLDLAGLVSSNNLRIADDCTKLDRHY